MAILKIKCQSGISRLYVITNDGTEEVIQESPKIVDIVDALNVDVKVPALLDASCFPFFIAQ